MGWAVTSTFFPSCPRALHSRILTKPWVHTRPTSWDSLQPPTGSQVDMGRSTAYTGLDRACNGHPGWPFLLPVAMPRVRQFLNMAAEALHRLCQALPNCRFSAWCGAAGPV